MSAQETAFELDNITLRLGPVLELETASKLKDTLADQLNGCALVVDAGAVEQVHAAVLQLFAAFAPAAEAAGVFIEWEKVSPAFREAAACLGLAGALKLPAAEAAA